MLESYKLFGKINSYSDKTFYFSCLFFYTLKNTGTNSQFIRTLLVAYCRASDMMIISCSQGFYTVHISKICSYLKGKNRKTFVLEKIVVLISEECTYFRHVSLFCLIFIQLDADAQHISFTERTSTYFKTIC